MFQIVPLAKLLREPLRNGKSAKTAEGAHGVRIFTLTAVTKNDFSIANTKISILTDDDAQTLWAEPGDIFIQRSNTPELVGTAALYNGPENFALFPDLLIRVRPSHLILAPFLVLYLHSNTVRRYFQSAARGIAGSMPKIGQEMIESLPVPVPPVILQRRIVAAVETQLSRLDAATSSLNRVKSNLKRARASVLKAAVEGRLVPTEATLARRENRGYEPASALLARILVERRVDWAEGGSRGRYREPVAPESSHLGCLPEGWTWATLEQLGQGGRPFAYGVLVPGPDVEGGVPFVRVGDIGDGCVSPSPEKSIARSVADKFSRTYLRGGEVLLSLVGTIGRTAVAPASLAGANVARAVGVLPMCNSVNSHYVIQAIRSPAVELRLGGAAHEVARKTLNMEDVRAFALPLPPLSEQNRIVAEVDRRLSVLAAIENTIKADLARCTRLRQSVLKCAFEGRTVQPEPSSGPPIQSSWETAR